VSISKILVAAGTPSKEICSLAKKQNIDLVIMGSVGRKDLKGFVMGNTAEKTLKNLSSEL
jgi:universal stress protein E